MLLHWYDYIALSGTDWTGALSLVTFCGLYAGLHWIKVRWKLR